MTAIFSVIDMFAGESPTLQFTVLNRNQTRVDLTGADIDFVIQKRVVDGDVIVTKSVGSGITILDQTMRLGVFNVAMDSKDTESVIPGTYYFESRVTLAGIKLTVAFGNLKIINSAF